MVRVPWCCSEGHHCGNIIEDECCVFKGNGADCVGGFVVCSYCQNFCGPLEVPLEGERL